MTLKINPNTYQTTKVDNKNKTSFKSSSNNTLPNDSIEISTKKNKRKKKLAISIVAVALATAATIFGYKKISAFKMQKALKEIDIKFANLEKDLPRVQKTFREIFLNDDLDINQTKDILTKYKELEKLRVDKKVSIKEYAQKVFEVAAKNYELEHANIKLVFEDLKRCNGKWQITEKQIAINKYLSKNSMFSTIHHELRHAKQSQLLSENLNIDEKMKLLKKQVYKELKEKLSNPPDYDTWSKETWPVVEEEVKKQFNYLKRKEFKKADKQFIQKLNDAQINYPDPDKEKELYWKNYLEIDARKAETLMDELLSLNKFKNSLYARKNAMYGII